MRHSLRWVPRTLAAGLALTITLAACGGDDDDDDAADGDSTTTVEAEGDDDTTTTESADEPTDTTLASEDGVDEPATLGVGETALGPTIVDADGFTLYVFDHDSGDTSGCVDACATAWPPLTVDGAPVLPDNIEAAAVLTITRPDGTSQVTFHGRPLYRFASDAQPGDTLGHGVGEVWWAVGPNGEALAAAP